MFLVLIFLALAAAGTYFFPEMSGAFIVGGALVCVLGFRLLMSTTGRGK
jgi:hypothetical protein